MNAEEVALARQLIAIAVDKESLARPTPAAYALLGSKLLQWPQDKLFPVTYSLSMCALFTYRLSAYTLPTFACTQACTHSINIHA